MGVLTNNIDLRGCPACTSDVNRLIIALDNSLDQLGNLTPPTLNMNNVFALLLIASTQKSLYNFDLRLPCQATCEVDKGSTDWLVTNWNCRNSNQGAHMATPISAILTNENLSALPPVHPGDILKDWLKDGEPERKALLIKYSGISEDHLEDIVNRKASLDRETALKLRPVLGETADLLFRMQYDFDEFQKTGHRPAKRKFPTLAP